MFYICEIQTYKDGTGAHIMFIAPMLNEVENKYHPSPSCCSRARRR